MAGPALEAHRTHHIGWLCAAALGANDGIGSIVSTASLIIGVAASSASDDAVLVAGLAGLVVGAMSMAAGEHARDELGISGTFSANPPMPAAASALAFTGGAALLLPASIWAAGPRHPAGCLRGCDGHGADGHRRQVFRGGGLTTVQFVLQS